MKNLTFSRTILLACLFAPACTADKEDTATASEATVTEATAATMPGTGTDPTPGTSTDPTPGTSTDPTPGTSTDPTTAPTTEPTTDPTTDPTAGDGMFCQEECAADEDCTLQNADLGFKCTDKRCVSGCADDAACVQQFSGWITDCTDQMGCPGQVCIDIGGGVGRCATPPSDFIMCETFMQTEAMFPPIEGGADLVVCANTDYQCIDNACKNPCESDQECVLPGLSQCDAATGNCQCADDAGCMAANPAMPKCTEAGFCGCASDDNCSGTPNTPTCTANGVCGCSTDDNCVAAMTGDTCYNGSCGCSDATACPATTVFGGTMQVCASL